MKNILLSTLFALITTLGFSQLTYVPDDAFEAYLESILGGAAFGNGISNDNYINSSNLSSQEGLVIQGNMYPITDFTGLEAFSGLNLLMLSNFFCSTIDISQVTSNQIQLHIENCPGVVNLYLPDKISELHIEINNNLKNINFSSNTEFVYGPSNNIYVRYNNNLECLDFSQISNLTSIGLIIKSNPILKYLNLNSGYCYAYSFVGLEENNMLSCVEVDDPNYSSNAASWFLDAPAIYSTTCANCIAEVDELPTVSINISPNPTSSKITIKASLALIGEEYIIYDQQGKAVKLGIITAEETEIDLSNLSEGVYLFKAGAEMQETFKIIKQ